MKSFIYKSNYDKYMDAECIRICNYLNSLPDTETYESCCGHGKDPFWIFFRCNSWRSISFLGRCLDRRYGGNNDRDIEIIIDNSDHNYNNAVYWLRTKSKGKEAYKSIDNFCDNMITTLNCENYIKMFMKNFYGFKVK